MRNRERNVERAFAYSYAALGAFSATWMVSSLANTNVRFYVLVNLVAAVFCVLPFVLAFLHFRRLGVDAGETALGQVSKLLPVTARNEIVEEWRAWLNDMRDAGDPWYRRLTEVASIVLVAAPCLAVTLRLRRKAAD